MKAERIFIDTSGVFSLLSKDDQRHEKAVDCSSFVLMEKLQLQASLTHDHDFAVAGFQVIL